MINKISAKDMSLDNYNNKANVFKVSWIYKVFTKALKLNPVIWQKIFY